jgi:hypothetical protein
VRQEDQTTNEQAASQAELFLRFFQVDVYDSHHKDTILINLQESLQERHHLAQQFRGSKKTICKDPT